MSCDNDLEKETFEESYFLLSFSLLKASNYLVYEAFISTILRLHMSFAINHQILLLAVKNIEYSLANLLYSCVFSWKGLKIGHILVKLI